MCKNTLYLSNTKKIYFPRYVVSLTVDTAMMSISTLLIRMCFIIYDHKKPTIISLPPHIHIFILLQSSVQIKTLLSLPRPSVYRAKPIELTQMRFVFVIVWFKLCLMTIRPEEVTLFATCAGGLV